MFANRTQRKNGQINTLMKNHEKAFSDIKNYYNDITLNNLALINSLKVFKLSKSITIKFLVDIIHFIPNLKFSSVNEIVMIPGLFTNVCRNKLKR